ncbi:MAG TPA: hypothetical protein VJ032_11030, partial [Thermoanaerobaculia bacterium]|nr:hypothetical protein [Thermoanaerobaculia bacterium]
AYVAETDTLLDQPSVVIVERILIDLARMRRDAQTLRTRIAVPAVALPDLAGRESAHSAIVA